jgi:thiamine pyrophosphate-dependent acetolactate synthase large subunit-like protein
VGYQLSRPGELRKLLPAVLASRKTTVIDCTIDPDEVAPLTPFVDGMKQHMQHLNLA